MKKMLAIVVILLVPGIGVGSAQSLGEIAKRAAEAKAAKEKDGKAKPPVKTVSNKDLAPTPPPIPREPIVVRNDPKTQEALAALRAVESVLGGGANSTEFKKYYLEAKVKVDALPPTPEHTPLRSIVNLYADAVTLSIAYIVRDLSPSDAISLKARYASDPEAMRYLGNIPSDGFTSRSMMTRTAVERAAIEAKAASQVLLIRASEMLRLVKVEQQGAVLPVAGVATATTTAPPSTSGATSAVRSLGAATTQKGQRCLRLAAAGSSYCWQHQRLIPRFPNASTSPAPSCFACVDLLQGAEAPDLRGVIGSVPVRAPAQP